MSVPPRQRPVDDLLPDPALAEFVAADDADQAEALTYRALSYIVDNGRGPDEVGSAAQDELERSGCLAAGLDPFIDNEHSVGAGDVIPTELQLVLPASPVRLGDRGDAECRCSGTRMLPRQRQSDAEVLCRQRGGDESGRLERHDHRHARPDKGCGESRAEQAKQLGVAEQPSHVRVAIQPPENCQEPGAGCLDRVGERFHGRRG
jgi:hypothetical protein